MSKRLETIELVIAKKPEDPFGYYAKAMELRSLGRSEEALAAFGEVGARFPDYVATYLMAAQLCVELARPAEARAWAERGIERAEAKGDGHAVSELGSFLAALPS